MLEQGGWAPLAEDIPGRSIRNGNKGHPINLDGMPLDHIPGFLLSLGILIAICDNLKSGKVSKATTSLAEGRCRRTRQAIFAKGKRRWAPKPKSPQNPFRIIFSTPVLTSMPKLSARSVPRLRRLITANIPSLSKTWLSQTTKRTLRPKMAVRVAVRRECAHRRIVLKYYLCDEALVFCLCSSPFCPKISRYLNRKANSGRR